MYSLSSKGLLFNVDSSELHCASLLLSSFPAALSSEPPLVVGRKTLVEAVHATTQNLGGKKMIKNICWVGGMLFSSDVSKIKKSFVQRFSAAEWSSSVSMVSTCKTSRIESK